MKQLYESIKERFIYEYITNINNEIITESIKATIIKEVAKQLLDQINTEKKEKEHDSYRSIYNKSFKDIFGQSRICWDKLEDKDIQKIEAQTWDEEKLKKQNEKLIRSIIKGDKQGIIISQNPETEKYEFVALNWGRVYYLTTTRYRTHAGSDVGSGYGRHYKDLTQREKIDLFSNKILYFIDTNQLIDNNDKIRNDRYQAKQGMINLDPYSLSKIAKDNVDRYKKIISQNKANNTKNDKLLDEAHEIIKKISEITIQVAKDPLSYADILSKIDILSKYVYDVRTYHAPRTSRDKGYYSGYNGLIPMIAKYIEAINDSKKGYSWGSKDIDSTVKNIQDTITKCTDLLHEIEDLL